MNNNISFLAKSVGFCALVLLAAFNLQAAASTGIEEQAAVTILNDGVGTILVKAEAGSAVITPKGEANSDVFGTGQALPLDRKEDVAIRKEAFQGLVQKAGFGASAAAGLSVAEQRETMIVVKSRWASLKQKAYRFGRLTWRGIKDAFRSLRKSCTSKNIKFALKVLFYFLVADGVAHLVANGLESHINSEFNAMNQVNALTDPAAAMANAQKVIDTPINIQPMVNMIEKMQK